MKKKLALLLAAVVASSGMTVTGFAANFKDINDVPWSGASGIITNAVNRGLLSGYEDNTFRAKNSVTYAEAMQMVYKVMQMTGKASAVTNADISRYSTFLNSYNVPAWSQEAVTYGLDAGILDTTDIAKFVTGGKNNAATREDVGLMFGRAMATIYTLDNMAIEAARFTDSQKITYSALPYIGLLVNKDVVNGDNVNNFNPQNNINRAEMAVMMNKTYDVLESEVVGYSTIGEITKYDYDGDSCAFTVTFDDGDRANYTAMPDRTTVYDGNTTKTISLARLAVGDRVEVIEEGGFLVALRLLGGSSSSKEKYDITGYIESIKGTKITFENENTGEEDSMELDEDCIYYIDGVKASKRTLLSEFEDNTKAYAYAGFITTTRLEKVKDDKNKSTKENVTYITEVAVEFSDNYTSVGTLEEISSSSLKFKAYTSGNASTYKYTENCQLYIGDKKSTASAVENLLDSSDEIFAKVTIDKNSKVVSAYFSEDDYATGDATKSSTLSVVNITEKKIIVRSSGKDVEYLFGSTNPISNIDFFTWDAEKGTTDWTSSKYSYAETYFENANDDDDTVYCRLEFNSGGKITDIYLSTKKSAWAASEDSSDFVTKKGTVESLNGTTLKFKTTSTAYKMLTQYNVKVGDTDNIATVVEEDPNGSGNMVKNPLTILGVQTSSLTVFKKMAQSDDVVLYAEVRVNSDNVIHAIEARVTEATGALVEYDKGDRTISIETSDGAKLNLLTRSKPSIVDEVCELDELEMARYNGSELLLTIDSKGLVEEIEILDSSVGRGAAKGIVTASGAGVKVAGSSTVYRWSTQDSIINNKSMESISLHYTKQLLADKDVEAYGVIRPDTDGRILEITITIQDASGEFQDYNEDNHTVRILTDAGNKLTFNTTKRPNINIDGVKNADINDKAVGTDIELKFNSDGLVTGFGD